MGQPRQLTWRREHDLDNAQLDIRRTGTDNFGVARLDKSGSFHSGRTRVDVYTGCAKQLGRRLLDHSRGSGVETVDQKAVAVVVVVEDSSQVL